MTTTTVSNTTALMSALSSAKAGDTIALTAGSYSNVSLNGLKFAGQVTITSADPSNLAVFNGLSVGGSSGLTFKNLQMTYSASLGDAALVGGNSSNITFDTVEVLASPSNRVGTGLFLRDSSNITVTNSNIHDLQDGIAHLNTTGLSITNNQIHDMSNDGVRGGGSSNITISGNTFTNFHPAEYAHNDAIQFWTINTTASAHDITVTNNTMIRGATGSPIQGLLMGNEVGLTYQNVTIANNVLIGEAYEGIHVDQASNLVMSHNLVAGYTDMSSWIEVINSTNATLTNNSATSWIFQNNSNVSQSGDLYIQQSAVGDLTNYNAWVSLGQVAAGIVTGSADAQTSGASTATGSAGSGVTTAVSAAQSYIGTDGDDSIHGTDAGNYVFGGLGNDTIVAGNGANQILGYDGDDSIQGGSGFDDINGNKGNDTIDGGAGGGDVLLGGQGNDVITVHASDNSVNGNKGNDTIYGGAGADTLHGGQADDLIIGGAGANQQLYGDLGNDTLIPGGPNATLTGGAGADVFQFTKLLSSPAVITDFTHGEDKLDLHALLQGAGGSDPIGAGYLMLSVSGSDTTVLVDIDGPGGAGGFVAVARLQGVTSLTSSDWIT